MLVCEDVEVAADQNQMQELLVDRLEGGDCGVAIVAVADAEAQGRGFAGLGLPGVRGEFEGVARRRVLAACRGIRHGERELGGDAGGHADAQEEFAAMGERGMDAVITGSGLGVRDFGVNGHSRHGGHVDDGLRRGADEWGVLGKRIGAREVLDAELDLRFFLGVEAFGRQAQGEAILAGGLARRVGRVRDGEEQRHEECGAGTSGNRLLTRAALIRAATVRERVISESRQVWISDHWLPVRV